MLSFEHKQVESADFQMIVKVRLFASHREIVGQNELTLEAPAQARIDWLAQEMARRHPKLKDSLTRSAFAINRRRVEPDAALKDGDQVVILPPVSGGAQLVQSVGQRLFRITAEKIDPEEVTAQVAAEGAGAIVVFHGVVRNRASSGRDVSQLEYEAYPEMAEETMAQIGREVRELFDVKKVAITHRIGRLAIGEASVVIAVSSAHRRNGFDACEYAIDRLKEIVPIWKKEIGPAGEEWIE